MNVLKDYVATNEFSLIVNSLRKTLPRTWTDNLNQLKKEALRDQAISDDLLRFWDKHIMKLAYYGDAFIRRGNIVIRRATWDEGITILEDAICALWIVSGLEHRPGIFGHTPE